MFLTIIKDRESRYFAVRCKDCGWQGSSEHALGGKAIADTGDYDDIYCSHCLPHGGAGELDEIESGKYNILWFIYYHTIGKIKHWQQRRAERKFEEFWEAKVRKELGE